MKKIFLFLFCFSGLAAQSQTKYQIGMGGGFSFLTSVNLNSGNVGLKFKKDKNVFVDFNRTVNKKYNVSVGAEGRLNLSSYWYEPDKSLPYYTEKPHSPIFQFESVELSLYIKKYFKFSVGENNIVLLFLSLGPTFNINEGSGINTRHGVKDPDRNESFQISYIKVKGQKLYIPYLRVSGGIEFLKKMRKKYWLGIIPFITWAGLQSENNEATILKNDPVYISTGNFKRNRSGYGVRLIFSK